MNPVVLIVDDSITVRMDLAAAFEAAGFRTVLCANAAEAREAMAHEPFSVVVLDLHLPDADGTDLLREIRASRTPTTPVMLLSTEAEVRDRVCGLATGADEYVGKPYDKRYIVSRARELLREVAGSARSEHVPILVIDDSATVREELTKALEDQGHTVVTASSGEEGLRVAADVRPIAIIVDGVLPGIDGGTVVRRIRLDEALRGTPCLLLTASEDQRAESRALDAGADAFSRKDQDTAVILARLTAMLRSAQARGEAPFTASLMGPKRILAVDDSATYLHAVAEALRGEGYDVVLARCGEEALEMLAAQPVDCILLDLLMPGLGGKETCRRIKAAPVVRDIPLIMLTAVEEREAMIEGLSTGADDYVSKSSDSEVLRARVRAQIRRKQFVDENRRIREELLRKEYEAAEERAARETAEARAVLVEELQRKNRELEAFSYSVSHDLRAPLRTIDGFSQLLLQEHIDQMNAKAQDYLRHVRAASQRMGELIDDLLQLSRVGRSQLSYGRTDLSSMAREVICVLQANDPARHAKFLIEDGLFVEADERLMRLVFENLLGNAWKFTAKVPETLIEFGASRRDAGLVYYVTDNGCGFDMKYADKLFGPFQRLHSEADFPGTGIGLATVHRVIERHGGRIWAESAVDRGTTFFFSLGRNATRAACPDGSAAERYEPCAEAVLDAAGR
jgi:DNA-binding response OmpR family regulator